MHTLRLREPSVQRRSRDVGSSVEAPVPAGMTGMTRRRAFLRLAALRLGCAAALAIALGTSCDDPAGVPQDLFAASSVVDGHYHGATVPGRDILEPPPGGREYASTIVGGHSHTVRLTQVQLLDLQQRGAVVSVDSSPTTAPGASQPHSHQFTFER